MLFSQTNIYRTLNKSNPIFFSENFKKKLILILTQKEFENEQFVGNLKKTSAALGLDIEEDVLFIGIPDHHTFNWAGILELEEPLTLVFFGDTLSGLHDLNINSDIKLGVHNILQTYSMEEIVTVADKKNKFWISFKSLFGR